MPVPSSISDLSTTPGSNSPSGSESVATNDDYLRTIASFIRSFNAVSASTIASAATTNIAASDGEHVNITGTASISSLGTGYAGCLREVYCSGTPTFVHSASLVLPGATNITATAGDFFIFRCLSSGVWALVVGSRVSLANAALTGTSTVNGVEIGYRTIPQTVQNANYSFVAADHGKAIVHTDTNPYTYTINTATHSADQVITVINDTGTGAITIAAGGGFTLYLAGTGSSGSRTLAVRGMATIVFRSSTVAYISGPGVS